MWAWMAAVAWATPWTLSAELGGEFNASSHGIANVSLSRGPWKLSLITDTLDLRYTAEGDRGKTWVALRGAAFAAGMVISPWEDGGPVADPGMRGHYAAVLGGGVRYLPHGLYLGAQGWAAWHTFSGDADPLPLGRFHVQPQALFGWWRPWLQAWGVAGLDLQWSPLGAVQTASPHARGEVVLSPDWVVAPVVEARAGWGADQDIVTRTRLGGLNPYVVPLAGAGWAEFWVEDYAALRLGVSGAWPGGRTALFADGAVFDGEQAVGFGLSHRLTWRRRVVDGAVGAAPFLERQEGVGAWSVYLLVGLDDLVLGGGQGAAASDR